ncbi:FAD-dependent oxidoreductase [Proteiniclasticum sp. SCR006]|uniref:Urocanate reductase n=1 Tax=Proteiniclasticum aestuarii TaxID=2817862 RepID=A0A939HBF3_9CLOT|nr:FAD-dependent oxidoreductase [Proteiniclasticum aestuarii]MBO1264862.1 FAD-dependent oxidoreductase [Proteiniclasticum aestuarii]
MKKLIVLLLTMMMLVSAGCGAKNEAPEETPGTAAESLFTEGTFEGTGKGHNGEIKVAVTFTTDRIEKIEVLDHKESLGIFEAPVDKIPKEVLEEQSLTADLVAGATVTSEGLLEAIENACIAAGADIESLKKAEAGQETEGEVVTHETDIVVVGAGIAGLSAAMEAVELGAKVILVEKMPIVGGSTTRSGGKILAAGTDIQKAHGIEDSAEAFGDFLMEVGENQVDEDYVRLIAEKSNENLEWLIEHGVEFADDIEPLHSTISPARGHYTANLSGAGMITPLEEEFLAAGGTILYETPAVELLTEGDKVIGIKATNPDKDDITIKAESVILATGGFNHNEEMMETYIPFLKNYTSNVGLGNSGDGITMAKAVGAKLLMREAGINLTVNGGTYYGYGEEFKGLFVNPEGERFMDESVFHFTRTRILMDHGINEMYAITTEYNDRIGKSMEMGLAFEADSVEALSELIGAEKLSETVTRYNELAEAGEDADFGKDASFMKPVEGEKYYALYMGMSSSGTFGGIDTDLQGRVYSEDGSIIEGLYAAGETASGRVLYKEYPGSGTAIMCFLTFGREAGRHAAEALK